MTAQRWRSADRVSQLIGRAISALRFCGSSRGHVRGPVREPVQEPVPDRARERIPAQARPRSAVAPAGAGLVALLTALFAAVSLQAGCALLGAGGAGGQEAPSGGRAPGAGSPSESASKDRSGKPTLLVSCLSDEVFLRAVRSLGGEGCYIIYQQEGESGGRLDEAKLRRSIASKIPQGHTGWAMLDFEGHWLAFLNRAPEDPAFAQGERAMLRLIEIAKEVRPTTKWTVYAVPNLPFFVKDDAGRIVGWDKGSAASKAAEMAKGRRPQRVVDACDWVSPSVYHPYSFRGNPEWRRALPEYVRASAELAKSMAGDKPVLPMIWHRIHDSNQKDGLELLTAEQWTVGVIEPALAGGADGVVWWGADESMLRSGGLGKRQREEFEAVQAAGQEAVRDYLRLLHLRKLQELRPYFE